MRRVRAYAGLAAALALLSLLLLAPWPGRAQVPTTIGYQGSLTDAAGAPITATLDMVFSLYDAPAAVTPLWSETQPVTVSNGVFSVLLGSATPFPANLFTGPRYLGVKVDTDAEMTPRLPFAAAPFALALDQDLDGWTISSGDCDDASSAANPGAAEVCDGLDNDCDGTVDDGDPGGGGACSTGLAGVCAAGTEVCTGGGLVCQPDVAPSPEVCDGLDNDCDGTADEGCACVPGETRVCGSSDVGVCQLGTETCQPGGTWGACAGAVEPSPELCDGLDNDCDGTTDDGAEATCSAGETCVAGSCQPIDHSGTWGLTPTVAYSCAAGLFSFSFSSVFILDTNPNLSVDTGDQPGVLTGSFSSGTDFSVSRVLSGSCTEGYDLTGSFTDANTFTGAFTATYTGTCLDCTNQSWSVTGTRP